MDGGRISLAIQWLGHQAPNTGDTVSIPGQGTKIPHAAWHSQRCLVNLISWFVMTLNLEKKENGKRT